jgi:two-component system KDP operon response regulator KdpE
VTTPQRILVVDDESSILGTMTLLLRSRGFDVESAMTGAAALARVEADPPDLLVLDLGLPDLDGLEVCRRVRGHSSIPILVLSARGSERDKVAALDLGADDYVTKPFGPDELLARVRACLRRSQGVAEQESGRLERRDLAIDFERRRVLRGSEEIRLTPKEFELLVYLARHPGRVLTHRTILKAIWGPNAVDQPQHLRVLMAALRKKIEPDPTHPRYVLTEPWVGYRFADE